MKTFLAALRHFSLFSCSLPLLSPAVDRSSSAVWQSSPRSCISFHLSPPIYSAFRHCDASAAFFFLISLSFQFCRTAHDCIHFLPHSSRLLHGLSSFHVFSLINTITLSLMPLSFNLEDIYMQHCIMSVILDYNLGTATASGRSSFFFLLLHRHTDNQISRN